MFKNWDCCTPHLRVTDVAIFQIYKLSKDQLVLYLRRDSCGYGAKATYPGVKHIKEKDHYIATYG